LKISIYFDYEFQISISHTGAGTQRVGYPLELLKDIKKDGEIYADGRLFAKAASSLYDWQLVFSVLLKRVHVEVWLG
jgi:hypothetical protein